MLALAFRTVMSIHAVPSDSMAPVLLPETVRPALPLEDFERLRALVA